MKMTIKYKLTAPLSHIGKTASTGSYFQTIITSAGKLPVITANSIRGQIRDSGAKHLLNTLGVKVDKEIFHVLFSGGNLSGTMRNDIEKARNVRTYFPLISVLGGGLGDIIMEGKIDMTFAYPVCEESEGITGVLSDLSWRHLIEEIEFTRTDDSKNERLCNYIEDIDAKTTAKASTQMRYSVQYIAAGTEFIQKVLPKCKLSDLEKGALLTAISEWFKHPTLGGMAAKGFGFFDGQAVDDDDNVLLSVVSGKIQKSPTCQTLIDEYESFLLDNDIVNRFNILLSSASKTAIKTKKESADEA